MLNLSKFFKDKVIDYVVSFIKLYSKYEYTTKKIYENKISKNFFLKKIFQNISNVVYYIKIYFFKYKLEPFNQYWISTSIFKNNDFNEKYILEPFEQYWSSTSIFNEKNIFLNNYLSFINKKPQNHNVEFLNNIENDNLFILKTNEIYVSRVCLKKNISFDEITPEKTEKWFLVVEYTHPEMTNSIILDVNNNYFVENNEILSSIFVLRCLKYQYEPYVFDERYTLKIIDNNINDIILKPNQYVKILRDKYVIEYR